jgi:hypothetical protein
MAKKLPKKTSGPYLAAAFFCDSVIQGKDEALTAVRIIDNAKFVVPANLPPDFPSKEKRLAVQLSGLLSFKTGKTGAGEHAVRVVMESPSGKISKVHEQRVRFSDPEHGGANIVFQMGIGVYSGGLFRFNVYLDGKFMTQMPFELTYERQQAPAQPAPQAGTDSTTSPAADSSPARKNSERRKKA